MTSGPSATDTSSRPTKPEPNEAPDKAPPPHIPLWMQVGTALAIVVGCWIAVGS